MTIVEAADQFLALHKSQRTRATYHQGLLRFFSHIQSRYALEPAVAPVDSLRIEHATSFLSSQMPPSVGSREDVATLRTALTYTAAVRKFYSYLAAFDIVPSISMEKLRVRLSGMLGRFQAPLPDVHTADLDQMLIYVKALPPQAQPERDLRRLKVAALVHMLYRTGLRVSELCALRRQDIDLRNGTAYVYRGKGGKSRVVRFDADTAQVLVDYWTARLDGSVAVALGRLPAFSGRDKPGRPGESITPRSVQRIVLECAQGAGVESTVTPHTFRHGLATTLVQRRVPESVVQRIMGHANLSTTQIYVHLVDEQVKDEYDGAFGEYRPPKVER